MFGSVYMVEVAVMASRGSHLSFNPEPPIRGGERTHGATKASNITSLHILATFAPSGWRDARLAQAVTVWVSWGPGLGEMSPQKADYTQLNLTSPY